MDGVNLVYQLITFDMYSATLDINGSAVPMVEKILNKDRAFSKDFFSLWRNQQWNYLLLNNSMEKGYKSYQYITRTVLHYTADKLGISLENDQEESLMKIWTSFKPWPEAPSVLKELKNRGYKIGMLSNGDQDMLAPLADATGVNFDYIFSADEAGFYKPNPNVYEVPSHRLGIKKDQWLHVAGSVFDVMGTKAAGYNCAWSNRYGDYVLDPKFEPDYMMKNLNDLLTFL